MYVAAFISFFVSCFHHEPSGPMQICKYANLQVARVTSAITYLAMTLGTGQYRAFCFQSSSFVHVLCRFNKSKFVTNFSKRSQKSNRISIIIKRNSKRTTKRSSLKSRLPVMGRPFYSVPIHRLQMKSFEWQFLPNRRLINSSPGPLIAISIERKGD